MAIPEWLQKQIDWTQSDMFFRLLEAASPELKQRERQEDGTLNTSPFVMFFLEVEHLSRLYELGEEVPDFVSMQLETSLNNRLEHYRTLMQQSVSTALHAGQVEFAKKAQAVINAERGRRSGKTRIESQEQNLKSLQYIYERMLTEDEREGKISGKDWIERLAKLTNNSPVVPKTMKAYLEAKGYPYKKKWK